MDSTPIPSSSVPDGQSDALRGCMSAILLIGGCAAAGLACLITSWSDVAWRWWPATLGCMALAVAASIVEAARIARGARSRRSLAGNVLWIAVLMLFLTYGVVELTSRRAARADAILQVCDAARALRVDMPKDMTWRVSLRNSFLSHHRYVHGSGGVSQGRNRVELNATLSDSGLNTLVIRCTTLAQRGSEPNALRAIRSSVFKACERLFTAEAPTKAGGGLVYQLSSPTKLSIDCGDCGCCPDPRAKHESVIRVLDDGTVVLSLT